MARLVIPREDAETLLNELNFVENEKWPLPKMLQKITQLPELLDDETAYETEASEALAGKICRAVEQGVQIVITPKDGAAEPEDENDFEDDEDDDVPVPAPKKPKKAEPKAQDPEDDAPAPKKPAKKPKPQLTEIKKIEEDAEADAPAPKKPAKPKKEKKEPVAEEESEDAPKAGFTPVKIKRPAKKEKRAEGPLGVRRSERASLYIAGQIVKKYGLERGITQEMVDEADEIAGRSNPIQTFYNLRYAWHAIRGYQGLKQDQ